MQREPRKGNVPGAPAWIPRRTTQNMAQTADSAVVLRLTLGLIPLTETCMDALFQPVG